MKAVVPFACVTAALLILLSTPAVSQDVKPKPTLIDADTTWTWTRDITVDRRIRVRRGSLTVAAGVQVTFKPGGLIDVEPKGALLAVGTEEHPVRFTGKDCGQIVVTRAGLRLEHCHVTGVGEGPEKRRTWLTVNGAEGLPVVKRCRVVASGGTGFTLTGPLELSGCDFRDCRGDLVVRGGKGRIFISGNTMKGANLTITGKGEASETVIQGNVIVGGRIYHARDDAIVVEGNYVHQPTVGNTYGLLRVKGVTRNNVLRGGSWVSAGLGGEVTGNVFISLPHEHIVKAKKSFDRNCTHEHICGLLANSRVTRNIFVGASYGAIMGIGAGTGSGSVIHNNTFDMHKNGNPFFFNHLPKVNPKDIRITGNIFMRSSGLWDEKQIADSATAIDYNLWSEAGKPRPYGKGGRFRRVTMTAKKPGDDGFGGHDVPPFGQDDKQPGPADVVVNPDVTFPFTDEEMLERKHTVAEVLDVYRKAYTPRTGSPAVDAGDPAQKDDPAVKDGKPDIGAVERVEP